jgi:hypothetical protein
MDFDKLNQWLTLLANVGVVVGLFALIAELNHSSRLAEVDAYQSRMNEIQNLTLQYALSTDFPEILERYRSEGVASLTPTEASRVRSWYNTILRQMQGQYYQYQQGFLVRQVIDDSITAVGREFYKAWSDFGLLGNLEIPEWRAEINSRVQ